MWNLKIHLIRWDSKSNYIHENHTTLLVKLRPNKWRGAPCSSFGRFHSVRVWIPSEFVYVFNLIPIRIQLEIFVNINKLILKFIWKCKGPIITKTTFKKKETWLILLDFKGYYWSIWSIPMCKDKQDWQKHNVSNGIENLEIDPHLYDNWLWQRYKAAFEWRKDSLVNSGVK